MGSGSNTVGRTGWLAAVLGVAFQYDTALHRAQRRVLEAQGISSFIQSQWTKASGCAPLCSIACAVFQWLKQAVGQNFPCKPAGPLRLLWQGIQLCPLGNCCCCLGRYFQAQE